jgi:hypothetical protein
MAQVAEQPAAAKPRVGKQSDPCVMIIFGAAGDLTARLLIPALYNLSRADLLSKEFAVLGVARAAMSDEDFRKRILDDGKEYCAASTTLPATSTTTSFTPRSKSAWLASTAITTLIKTLSSIWPPRPVSSGRSWKSFRPTA